MTTATHDDTLTVRPMTADDLDAAVTTSAAAFGLDLADPAGGESWRRRVAHVFATDPGGAFVAERDGAIIGVAEAMVRERLWVLGLLTIDPQAQSAGAGRALMEAALEYGAADTDAGVIVSSNDSRAIRLYGRSGFRLKPTFETHGTLDRSALPAGLPALTDGSRDLEALAAISREVRGGPHTSELPFALWRGAQILRLGDRGFAVAQRGHGVWLLVARDAEAGAALLWQALELAVGGERPPVRWITQEQDWAIEVVLRAGFRLTAYGALCVRGNPGTLRPYLPSGPFA